MQTGPSTAPSQTSTAATMAYRPDVDGLRAIAVISVVIFHLNKTWLPGGFAGVDVFFVISGYLITLLVYGQICAGQFSFQDFYRRRINRIAPALFAVVLASIVVGMVILAPRDLVRLVTSVLYTLGGLSNFFFWMEYGNYFSNGVEEAPLLNTWSLAVEEQFYVFWPIFLIGLARLPTRMRWLALLAVLALAVAVSELGVRSAASASYYLLPTRFFELLSGSALAVFVHHRLFLLRGVAASAAGVAGLLLIAASFILLGDADSFPGVNAIYPCIGAVLVIASGTHADGVVARMLAVRPMVFFGLISYSLYLWHWPIIAYLRYLDIEIDVPVAAAVFLGSVALSWLSWRYVESPFRHNRGHAKFPVLVLCRYAAPVAVIGSVALLVWNMHGIPERFDPRVARYEGIIATAPNELRANCHVPTLHFQTKPSVDCMLGDGSGSADGILIGDSYANHFTGMIDVLARRDGVSVMDYTMDGCLPIKGVALGGSPSYSEKCRLRNDFSYKHILSAGYKYVILAGSWPTSGAQSMFDAIEHGLNESLRIITASGARPIVILNNPRIKNADKCPVRRLMFHRADSCESKRDREDAMQDIFSRLKAAFPEMVFIDPSVAICEKATCKPLIGETPLYRDDGHLNDVGSRLIGTVLLARGVHLLPRREAVPNSP